MEDFFVDPDITKARTLNKNFYTDPIYFHQAKTKIFSSSWQFIGDASLIDDPGSCFPFTLLENYLDEPLVLIKDKDNSIYCHSNVCTHRGNILVYEQCNLSNIRCKYHGRLFKLNGAFISMPEFKEVKDFPSVKDDLVSLPVTAIGNLLFTSLSGKAQNYFFDDMINRIKWLPLSDFKFQPQLSRNYFVNAHWALYCENYLEGFHIPFVHTALNSIIDYGSYTTELFKFSNLQLGFAKDNEDCFDIPENSPDYGKRIAAFYFWIFPNIMFNFYPWGLSVNLVQPLDLNRTKVSFLTYLWKKESFNRGAGSNLDKVEMEDEEVVQNVQKGIRSSFYQYGRYSPSREQGTHHFHRLLAEFMNK